MCEDDKCVHCERPHGLTYNLLKADSVCHWCTRWQKDSYYLVDLREQAQALEIKLGEMRANMAPLENRLYAINKCIKEA